MRPTPAPARRRMPRRRPRRDAAGPSASARTARRRRRTAPDPQVARTAAHPAAPRRCSARPAATTSRPARSRDRPTPSTGADADAAAAGRRRPGAAGPGHRRRLGGRGLGRPRLVRGPGERRPLPVAGAAGRRRARARRACSSAGPRPAATSTPRSTARGDPGVSRRQAQLTTDGQRWWVEDLQSSNGTYVGPASGPLPTDPVPPGQRRELVRGRPDLRGRLDPARRAPRHPGGARPVAPTCHNFLARCGNLHLRPPSVPVRR